MAIYVESPNGSVYALSASDVKLGVMADYKRIPAAEGKRKLQESARADLLKMLKPGDTVYTVLRHVSASGMMRHIDLFVMADNKPCCISYYAACLLDDRRADNGAIKVGGCGMDMGFHLVYNLASVLFGAFYNNGQGWACIGKDCPSSDHQGASYEPHTPDRMHDDGGYALRQSWL